MEFFWSALYIYVCVSVLSRFSHVQLLATPWTSLPGSSVHGILQARILEWAAVSFSRGSSQPRDLTCISCTVGRFFSAEPPEKPVYVCVCVYIHIYAYMHIHVYICICTCTPPPHTHTVSPSGTSGKASACQCRRYKRCGSDPSVGKISWRRACQRTSVFLPGECYGWRGLAGYSPWGRKESDTAEAT